MREHLAGSQAYRRLLEDIVTWELAPGAPVAEVEQAARLGLSRTPVREAITRLRIDGLLRPQGARGAVVTELRRQDVRDLFEARLALERALVRAAARNVDLGLEHDLHRVLADLWATTELTGEGAARYHRVVEALDDEIEALAANPYLVRALDGIRLQVLRLRQVSRDDPERLRASVGEHVALVKALVAGDVDHAEAALTMHLRSSLAHILAVYPARA